MKRIWTILVVTAMALTTTLAAGAKPPPWAGGGGDGLEGGTTCLESLNVDYAAAFSDDFEIGPLPSGTHCVDVSGVVPGSWSVGYSITKGDLRQLIIQVRDSVAPGDLCKDIRFGKKDPLPSPITFDVSAGDWVNACGTQYAEAIAGQDYWEEDQFEQSPLALVLWVSGSKDVEVTFNVDVPTP